MAREDRDFRNLLIDTLNKIGDIYSSFDTRNDVTAYNRLIETVNFLEDLIHPYTKTGNYKPIRTDDKYQNVHHTIRAVMGKAMEVALMPPEEMEEDATTITG